MASDIDLEAFPSADDPEPVRLARAFLQTEGAPPPATLPVEVGEALVAALVRYEDSVRLGALAAVGDKALAKLARRGLHRLRGRGIQADVPRPQAAAPRAATPEAEPTSLISAAIRDGERILWSAREADTKVEVFQIQLHEVRGLTSFQALRTARK